MSSEELLDRNVKHGGVGAVWVRSVHKPGFQREEIRMYVRPGDRSDPRKFKGNPLGEPIAVRFISKPGNQALGVSPEFDPDDGTTIEMVACFVKRLDQLTEEDLQGAAPDYATSELVAHHVGMTYDRAPLEDDELVTVFRFKHLPSVTSMEEWHRIASWMEEDEWGELTRPA